MEKRFMLAIVLSVLILLTYQAFVVKMYPKPSQGVIENDTKATVSPAEQVKESVSLSPSLVAEKIFLKETGKLIFTFSNIGGRVKEVLLKDYNKTLLERDFGVIDGYENAVFEIAQIGSSVIYSYRDQEIHIVKTFNFSEERYLLDLEILFINNSTKTNNSSYRIYNGALDLGQYSQKELAARDKYFLEVSLALPDKLIRKNISAALKEKLVFTERADWVGIRDRYFCAIFYPLSPVASVFIQAFGQQKVTNGFETVALGIPPGEKYTFYGSYYIGPQDIKLLQATHQGFDNIVNFGTFDIISQGLLYAMRFLHSHIHSWGICVILISFLVFFVLFPLTAKSLSSMKKMQQLQPQIERVREQFKNQPQKLNKEIMDLYRAHKVNPFGGCLPMFLQIPVFFGLYQALMRSVELKGSRFLWIEDLAEPDRLFRLKNSLPVIGDEINILPIIMTVGMFFQQKMSMKTTSSSTMQEQQKIMMIVFPLMFGFLFYRFPSGLTLYWVSYTILSILSQKLISRPEKQ